MGGYTAAQLGDFFDGYRDAALWDMSTWAYSYLGRQQAFTDDLAGETDDRMLSDCKRFLDMAWPVLEQVKLKARDMDQRIDNYRAWARGVGNPTLRMAGWEFYFNRGRRSSPPFSDSLWPKAVASELRPIAQRFGVMHLHYDRGKIRIGKKAEREWTPRPGIRLR